MAGADSGRCRCNMQERNHRAAIEVTEYDDDEDDDDFSYLDIEMLSHVC